MYTFSIGQDTTQYFNVHIDIPEEFSRLEGLDESRRVYQTETGEAFAFSISKDKIDDTKVPLIGALSLFELQKKLPDFQMIHEDKGIKLNDYEYCLFVYLYKDESGEEIINYMYLSSVEKKLLTYNFTCSYAELDVWLDVFGEILSSVEIKY